MSNTTRIRPLSDSVINQIAAGEVIERPASIVKELLENSLDAGADRITIEVSAGGVERICVRDNGRGIAPDQLNLALTRHCTSKLAEATDLDQIESLGFRGEALASIAAVCEVAIVSRTAVDAHGWRMVNAMGQAVAPPKAFAHPPGTSVEANSLFATLPARRRFLKQKRTEFLHVQQLVRRVGFCYPDVAIKLIHDGRDAMVLPGIEHASSRDRRWRVLFGSEFLGNAKQLSISTADLSIRGWTGVVGYGRQSADMQVIAVNGRVVSDRHISHAVRMAYDNSIEEGRYPAFALHLEVPTTTLDVNVHPGKAEVRFSDPRSVHDFVYAAVKQTLLEDQPQSEDDLRYPIMREPVVAVVAEPRIGGNSNREKSPYREPGSTSTYTLLTIASNRFALLERGERLELVDLHATIEAVVNARLGREKCRARPLIIPESFAGVLSSDQFARLASFGVEFDCLSEGKLVLRSLPVAVTEVDFGEFARVVYNAIGASVVPLEAIARAAAEAFRTPGSLADRRMWFTTHERLLADNGLPIESFTKELEAPLMAQMFDRRDG